MNGVMLYDLTRDGLTDLLANWGEPTYRARQVWEWIYKKLATHPSQMTNLPAVLRNRLVAETRVESLERVFEQRSSDQHTIKWVFRLQDGLTIETVLMLYDERRTVCISTQAGCAMGCVFCATGQGGLARNLTAGEIIAQVLAAARYLAAMPKPQGHDGHSHGDGAHSGLVPLSAFGSLGSLGAYSPEFPGEDRPSRDPQQRLTNIVVMGMGEPFANYERVWQALQTITDKDGFGLGARHITVSTVGLPQGIRKMATEPLQVNLAVSLHAPNDELRGTLLPINQRYPIRRGDGRNWGIHPAHQPPCHVRVRDDGWYQRHPPTGRGACGPAQAATQPNRRRHVPRKPHPAQPGCRVPLSTIDRRERDDFPAPLGTQRHPRHRAAAPRD